MSGRSRERPSRQLAPTRQAWADECFLRVSNPLPWAVTVTVLAAVRASRRRGGWVLERKGVKRGEAAASGQIKVKRAVLARAASAPISAPMGRKPWAGGCPQFQSPERASEGTRRPHPCAAQSGLVFSSLAFPGVGPARASAVGLDADPDERGPPDGLGPRGSSGLRRCERGAEQIEPGCGAPRWFGEVSTVERSSRPRTATTTIASSLPSPIRTPAR